MSWLAYEKNPYSTHWVRLGSCHRETSLGYDIFLLSLGYKPTWISDFFTMRQHFDAPISGLCNLTTASTTLSYSVIASMTRHLHHAATKLPRQHRHQHDSAALLPTWLSSILHRGQVNPAASSLAWLGSIVASMTQHLHRVTAKSPWQHRRQHDSVSTSCHSQAAPAASSPTWLGSIVTSMTRHLHYDTAKSPR
jgi:hypothetical protein